MERGQDSILSLRACLILPTLLLQHLPAGGHERRAMHRSLEIDALLETRHRSKFLSYLSCVAPVACAFEDAVSRLSVTNKPSRHRDLGHCVWSVAAKIRHEDVCFHNYQVIRGNRFFRV